MNRELPPETSDYRRLDEDNYEQSNRTRSEDQDGDGEDDDEDAVSSAPPTVPWSGRRQGSSPPPLKDGERVVSFCL